MSHVCKKENVANDAFQHLRVQQYALININKYITHTQHMWVITQEALLYIVHAEDSAGITVTTEVYTLLPPFYYVLWRVTTLCC